MKKKWIYFAALLTVCLLIVTTVPSFASWLFSQTNESTVMIKGSDAKLYADSDCTIPLSGTLNFGDVRTSTPTNSVTIYLKNLGTDAIRPTATITNLAAGLIVTESTYGVITENTKLYKPASGIFTPTTTNSLGVAASDIQSTIQFSTGNFPAAYPFYFKIDNELIKATSLNIGYMVNVERSQIGTIAAAHTINSTVTFGTVTPTAEINLPPNTIQPICLTITAQEGITIGTTVNFQITINATSDY